MNRLVQGDVGAGKTVVAVVAILAAIQSGYQAALMAPHRSLSGTALSQISRLAESTPASRGITNRVHQNPQTATNPQSTGNWGTSGVGGNPRFNSGPRQLPPFGVSGD